MEIEFDKTKTSKLALCQMHNYNLESFNQFEQYWIFVFFLQLKEVFFRLWKYHKYLMHDKTFVL